MANTIEVPDTIPGLTVRLEVCVQTIKKRLGESEMPELAEHGVLKDMDELLDLIWLELNRHQQISLEQTTQYLQNRGPTET